MQEETTSPGVALCIAKPVIECDPSGRAQGGIITSGSLVAVSVDDSPMRPEFAFQIKIEPDPA